MKYEISRSHYKIEVENHWLVLDVGSGDNPHPRADVLIDSELGKSDHRSGRATRLVEGKSFILADGNFLPFKDKAFDYVLALHVAEHLKNPDKFCRELMRVGKRGYIEAPSRLAELFLGEPVHRWFVRASGSTLIFSEKSKRVPVSEFLYALYYFGMHKAGHMNLNPSNRLVKRLVGMMSNILDWIWVRVPPKAKYTYFEWEESFAFKIEHRKSV